MLTVTGHRQVPYPNGSFAKLVDFAREKLAELQPDMVLSGMALGWDQACAIAAIQLSIPLHAVVPFSSQYIRWPEKQQFIFAKILCKADEVTVLHRGSPSDKTAAVRLLNERNVWMVRRADMVLALYSGRPGGTRNAVNFAKGIGKPVVNVWDGWLSK